MMRRGNLSVLIQVAMNGAIQEQPMVVTMKATLAKVGVCVSIAVQMEMGEL